MVVQASGHDASCLSGVVFRALLCGRRPQGIPGHAEEMSLSAGLGMVWDLPRGDGRGIWGEESLGFPIKTAGPATQTQISGRK